MEVSQSLNFTPRPGFLKRTNYTDLLGSLVGAPEKSFNLARGLKTKKARKRFSEIAPWAPHARLILTVLRHVPAGYYGGMNVLSAVQLIALKKLKNPVEN